MKTVAAGPQNRYGPVPIMFSPEPTYDALAAIFARHGCIPTAIPILQPAGIFLDLSGEDIRRRLFLTQDGEGREFCLRPEWTIPVCLAHLAGGSGAGRYSYLGPVWRQGPTENGEFQQAGAELIGDADTRMADAEALRLGVEGLAALGLAKPSAIIGDMALLAGFCDALRVPPAVRRRLVRALASGGDVAAALRPDPRGAGPDYAGLMAAIEGQDRAAARAFVEDVISIAGIAQVGGRSAGEIADRFLAKAGRRSGDLSDTARDLLLGYVAVSGSPDAVDAPLAMLARDAGSEAVGAVDAFRRRNDAIAGRSVGRVDLVFQARFARSLDYYTGFIFELRDLARPDLPLVGGGRYDQLLAQLGASAPVPAVGCSFWLDRLKQGGAR